MKFSDPVRARANPDGSLTSLTGADLGAAQGMAVTDGFGFRAAIDLPGPALAALESVAMARSGVQQPDLQGLLEVVCSGAATDDLVRFGNDLAGLPGIEFVELFETDAPPPGDIAPPTPDLSGLQTYLGPDPGLNIDAAWKAGFRGQGIRLSDCEYGWNAAHEDLNDVDLHPEAGQTIDPQVAALGYDEHGTAALGVVVGASNDYGFHGLATGSSAHVFTEWSVEEGKRRITCITNALAQSAFGDVVLLEMQMTGAGGGYGPAELSQSVWMVVKAGTDAGVVVVAAAGNGAQDLDGPAYASYMARGDSGAILVGAGGADVAHAPLSFSTFGSRVDVQGWGAAVATLGYGAYATYGGDKNQKYTSTFNGTSSASALIAGTCAVVQSAAKAKLGLPLTPSALRALLKSSGLPQGAGGHVGPLPNAKAAIDALPKPPWTDLGFALAGVAGKPKLAGSGSLQQNSAWTMSLTGSARSAPCLLAVGAQAAYLPFKAGTLVPVPTLLFPLTTSPSGTLDFAGTIAPAMPAGAQSVFQVWIVDATAPAGMAASNGLLVSLP